MRPEEDDNHDFGPDGVYNYDHLKIVNLMVVISGGDKPIERRKLSWTSKSKIGSLEKANHRPGGGQVDIFLYIFFQVHIFYIFLQVHVFLQL